MPPRRSSRFNIAEGSPFFSTYKRLRGQFVPALGRVQVLDAPLAFVTAVASRDLVFIFGDADSDTDKISTSCASSNDCLDGGSGHPSSRSPETPIDPGTDETLHQQKRCSRLHAETFAEAERSGCQALPLGMVSWLGKKRSYESSPTWWRDSMVRVRIAQPSFRAVVAGIARSKNIHTWPPFPDRERSSAAGTFNSRQTARNAAASFCHAFLSKSTARNQQVSSCRSG